MDKRCFWSLSIFSIQNRSIIFGFVPMCRQLILYRFPGCWSIHLHQFECHQKAKTDEAYQPQLSDWLDEKGGLYFPRQLGFFQYDFHHKNLTKNTYTSSPASNYLFKVHNRNTKTRYEICSKLTIKIPKRYQWDRSCIFIVNFQNISHLVVVFLLLTLSM